MFPDCKLSCPKYSIIKFIFYVRVHEIIRFQIEIAKKVIFRFQSVIFHFSLLYMMAFLNNFILKHYYYKEE